MSTSAFPGAQTKMANQYPSLSPSSNYVIVTSASETLSGYKLTAIECESGQQMRQRRSDKASEAHLNPCSPTLFRDDQKIRRAPQASSTERC